MVYTVRQPGFKTMKYKQRSAAGLRDAAGVEDGYKRTLRNRGGAVMGNRHGMSRVRVLPDGVTAAHPKENVPGRTEMPPDLARVQGFHASAILRTGAPDESFFIANSR